MPAPMTYRQRTSEKNTMKTTIRRRTVAVLMAVGLVIGLGGCESLLEPEVYGSLTPQTFFQSEADFLSAVVALYAPFGTDWGHTDQGSGTWYNNLYNHDPGTYWGISEISSDGMYGWWGTTFDRFTWGLTVGNSTYYKIRYVARATDILDKIETSTAPIRDDVRRRYAAEARTLRAWLMFVLYDFYGPVNAKLDVATLYDTSITPRLSREEYVSAMVADLNAAIPNLPDRISAAQWGRVDKGTARMILLRIHMMEKNWPAAEAVARELTGMGYALVDQYEDICNVQRNSEMIYAAAADAALSPNWYWMEIVPSNFATAAGSIQHPGGWHGFGMPWDFYNDMYTEEEDQRLRTIVTEYTNKAGGTVNRASGLRAAIPMKCTQGLGLASGSGQDWPVFRYAEVLLSLAEAINEQRGPGEALPFANQVRRRAGVPEWSNLSQEELRDALLDERGREFYGEGVRRQDLIRHGRFIERALAQGALAQPHHVLFPIPLAVILEGDGTVIQNCGYSNATSDCYDYNQR
jgi:starch-binding outer membrane protein, SusD/RagB family